MTEPDTAARAALREAITALSCARDYIHFEASHQATENELRRVTGVVRAALDTPIAYTRDPDAFTGDVNAESAPPAEADGA